MELFVVGGVALATLALAHFADFAFFDFALTLGVLEANGVGGLTVELVQRLGVVGLQSF